MAKLTCKAITKAVHAAGIRAEAVKGDGYIYFIGPDTESAYTASVFVPRLGDLTLEQWVEQARAIKQDHQQRRSQ